MYKKKIIRSTTVPISLTGFCSGLLKELSKEYEVIAVSSPGKELQQIHESDGIRTIAVQMERQISPIKDLKSLIKMIKVFRKEKPYMVHSMTPKAGLICMMAAWVTRVPRRVHTFTGLVWPTATGIKRKVLVITDKIICFCATHIIPEGEGVKNDLQSCITRKPMRVLGYGNCRGVDMDYWKVTEQIVNEGLILKKRLGLVPKEKEKKFFVFCFVGRIVGDKGVNELIEAFVRIQEYIKEKKNETDVRLLLIGRFEDNLDPIKDNTRNIIDSNDSIITTGPQYRHDLLLHYAISDCFVLPSYREGFPNTPIEAGAMGLPSIVTDINGSREIVVDKLDGCKSMNNKVKVCRNGIVVPPKDCDAMYEAMLMMVENEHMRKQMAENARSMIGNRFEQGFVRKCLFDFYKEII